MKIKRNYKRVDEKIWRVLTCKEVVALCDFLYKVWFVKKIFPDQLEPTFLANFFTYIGKPVFHLV